MMIDREACRVCEANLKTSGAACDRLPSERRHRPRDCKKRRVGRRRQKTRAARRTPLAAHRHDRCAPRTRTRDYRSPAAAANTRVPSNATSTAAARWRRRRAARLHPKIGARTLCSGRQNKKRALLARTKLIVAS